MRRDSRIDAHHRSSEIAWDETMLGCMVSSSVSVTAAAHLSPLIDYADLDGNLLTRMTPTPGSRYSREN
jgi:L-alanine-DL-glutamate epimerase-like enolase superfamily enzyme